jgi:Ca2+-binding RTX toxin-like protein
VWVIHGDPTFDNTIVIRRSPQSRAVLQAVVNGQVVSRHGVADLSVLQVYGGAGDDSISVKVANKYSSFAPYLYGRAGNDTLVGTRGSDVLVGGRGDNTLVGGPGNNTLVGRGGNNTFVGVTTFDRPEPVGPGF